MLFINVLRALTWVCTLETCIPITVHESFRCVLDKHFVSQTVIVNFFCSAALLGICLESYGKYRISLKDANKAIKLFTEALEISRKVFGTKHQQVSVVIVIYQ
jgi:hypothetical protein